MSLTVFAIVLFSAALHAVWNAVVRGAGDALRTTVLIAAFSGVIALCALPALPPPAPASWPYLALSGTLEIGYYGLLAATYRRVEMSRSYPLMRGTAPLLVVLVSTLVLGVTLSAAAWGGVVLICAGLLGLALRHSGETSRAGVQLALLNAVVIASYTLVDGAGVRLSGSAAGYAMWVFVLCGLPFGLWGMIRLPGLAAYARANWLYGLVGGLGTLTAYGLVLWAMTEAPVPLVAALRETSILFGTAIAALVLRERVSLVRVAAVLVVAAGAMLLRLA